MDNPVARYAAGTSLPMQRGTPAALALETPLLDYQKLNKTRLKSDPKAASLKHNYMKLTS